MARKLNSKVFNNGVWLDTYYETIAKFVNLEDGRTVEDAIGTLGTDVAALKEVDSNYSNRFDEVDKRAEELATQHATDVEALTSTIEENDQKQTAAVEAEATARASAITAEHDARVSADNTEKAAREKAISDEIAAREGAIKAEADTRAAEDAKEITAREQAVAAEAKERKDADATEAAARAAADTAETSAREQAVAAEHTAWTAAVDKEIADRKSAIEAEVKARNDAIEKAVQALIGGAPETFDTLKEISDWIKSDESGTAALITRVGDLEDWKKTTDTSLATMRSNISTNASSISANATTESTHYSELKKSISDNDTKQAKALSDLETALSAEISALKTKDTSIDSSIAAVKKTADSALQRSGGQMTGKITVASSVWAADVSPTRIATLKETSGGSGVYEIAYITADDIKTALGITDIKSTADSAKSKADTAIQSGSGSNGVSVSKSGTTLSISGVTASGSSIGVTKLYTGTSYDTYAQTDGGSSPAHVQRAIITESTALDNLFNATTSHRGTMSKEDKSTLNTINANYASQQWVKDQRFFGPDNPPTGISSSPYVYTFTGPASSGKTITAATHGKGTYPLVKCFVASTVASGALEEVYDSPVVKSNGDVVVYTDMSGTYTVRIW